MKIIDGIYNEQESLEETELKALAEAFETIKVPKSFKGNEFPRKAHKGQFGLIFASCAAQTKKDQR